MCVHIDAGWFLLAARGKAAGSAPGLAGIEGRRTRKRWASGRFLFGATRTVSLIAAGLWRRSWNGRSASSQPEPTLDLIDRPSSASVLLQVKHLRGTRAEHRAFLALQPRPDVGDGGLRQMCRAPSQSKKKKITDNVEHTATHRPTSTLPQWGTTTTAHLWLMMKCLLGRRRRSRPNQKRRPRGQRPRCVVIDT